MFLKALNLKGFKSFADATTLEFEPGVTVVVGPNGSGKSNVVDAVAWVLGAQGPRTVRSAKMDDVIFAGSPRRAALGRAEVSLTIDNSAGLVPIDFSEVTITRTLFRSGDSEYAINRVPCRLLDVQELLSDTGVGRQQHVIVSQGNLDGILSSRPEDRRLVIEEAAGVLKYRKRKERSERRLESTESSLLRLQDLLREVRRQLRPLEKQADAARRHGELHDELVALQRFLAGRQLIAVEARLAASAQTRGELTRTESEIRATLGRIDADVVAAEAELGAVRRRHEGRDLAEMVSRAEGLRARAAGLVALLDQRRRSVARELAVTVDHDVVASLEAEAAGLAVQLEATEADTARLATDRQELAAAEAELDAVRARTEARRSPGAGPTDPAAESRGELGARRDALERARSELRHVDARVVSVAARVARLEEEAQRLVGVGAELDIVGPGLAEAVAGTERALAAAVAAAAAADERRRVADAEQSRWQAREEALALALDAARARAGAVRLVDVSGVVGTLLELVQVDDGLGAAFEAAAGEVLSAVIMDGPDAAGRAVEELRRQDVGGAVVALPFPVHPSDGRRLGVAAAPDVAGPDVAGPEVAGPDVAGPDVAGPDVAGSDVAGPDVAGSDVAGSEVAGPDVAGPDVAGPGVSRAAGPPALGVGHRVGVGPGPLDAEDPNGLALPVGATPLRAKVRSRLPAVSALLDELLAPTVVVDGWTEAVSLVSERPDLVVVTVAGDRCSGRLWRTGTGGAGATGAELDEARERVRGARSEAELTGGQLRLARQALEAARTAHHDADRAADLLGARRRSAVDGLRRSEGDLADARSEARSVRHQREEVVGRIAADDARMVELEALLPALEAAATVEAERVAAEQLARSRLQERAAAVGALRHDLEVRAAGLGERRTLVTRRSAEVEDRLRRNVTERRDATIRRERLGRQSDAGDRLAVVVAARRSDLLAALDRLRAARQARAEATVDVTDRLDRLRRERAAVERRLSEVRERVNRADLDEAEARVRLESLTEAVRRELDCEPDATRDAVCPPTPPGSSPAGRRTELERELRLMGPINPLALEEFTALQERHGFLEAQLDDVRSARRELGKVIRAVDAEIEEIFRAAFTDVADNFEKLFATLFPGGQGRLRLTDPDHLLDTGVEVEARPSGKNVRRLSLLSGGERSLTAMAFLFAVFRSRPSPFYLLDEVEAALDDVNLHRFLDLVGEFRAEAQLVIVTHQKRTMEAADCLYGVTMAPGGSSRVIRENVRAGNEAGVP